jgi:hypothetical protein
MPPWWYTPIKIPSPMLKTIHVAIQAFLKRRAGSGIDERISGTAGSKNRASWCGKMLSRATPERAETRIMVICALRRKKRSGAAGPSN